MEVYCELYYILKITCEYTVYLHDVKILQRAMNCINLLYITARWTYYAASCFVLYKLAHCPASYVAFHSIWYLHTVVCKCDHVWYIHKCMVMIQIFCFWHCKGSLRMYIYIHVGKAQCYITLSFADMQKNVFTYQWISLSY